MTPNNGYYAHATVAGETLVFVCEDDLWTVPLAGGIARRLSVGAGDVTTPRLSPDGTTLAFVTRDEGSPEISVMPAHGGPARRITFLGSDACMLSGWTPDGNELLFASDARSAFGRETHGFRISKEGGAPAPLGLGHIRSLSAHPNGRLLIGRNNDDPARWKRYRGGTAGDLWIERPGGEFERLIATGGNACWPLWAGDRVVFLSDHEGVGNLYLVDQDGGNLERLTNETEYFARFPSTDGRSVVYTAGAQVRVLDLESRSVRTLEIETPSTAPQRARRFIEIVDDLETFEPSPDGTAVGLISRGRPITMPLWEEAAVEHGSGSRVRYRELAWLHGGARFVCVSDEGGRERLEVRDARSEQSPEIVTDTEIGRVTELAASPTADVVAVANHRNELLLIDLQDKAVRVVDTSPASRMHDLAFSPDGRWLAYCCAVAPNGGVANADTSIVRIVKVKSGNVHDVTPLMRTDRNPVWDPEGRYLFFISTRDFNPVYDALQFDLSFPQASRPFVVTLREDVPSPFVPKPSPVHRESAQHRREDDDDHKDDKPERIDIDFDGITGRILAFPVPPGEYGQIVAARGRVLFTQYAVKGITPESHSWDDEDDSGTLYGYDFEQQRSVTMAREVDTIRLGADRRTLAYTSHDRLRVIDALGELPDDERDEEKPESEPGRRSGWLDLTRASVEISVADEWAQMYDEAWRMQNEQFWDANMSGVDWRLVHDRYAKLLPLIRTRGELSDVLWEMYGELGTSHAYEIGGDRRTPPQYRRGFLGADFTWDESLPGYRIDRIYRGDSWNRDADSPLAEPGAGIAEGDAIVAIGGRTLSRTFSPDEALVNSAGRDVALTIVRKKDRRRVLVRTLRSDKSLLYRAWVEANRRTVHERTQGRVGYLHVPDMGPWGFSEFHRGYLSEFDRDALIVDVRYNRGGHVSPLLLEKLARKRVGYDVPRYGPPVPYPPESVGGPIVALTNQFAGSDGDIFSHCFKMYALGPLVGKRTWGGVIGINPYHRLVDGTITTQPEFSFWFNDVGWRVENYGTDPDFDIDIAPHHERDGKDPQMDKALELALAAIAARSNGKPHFGPRPSLPLPETLPVASRS